MWQIKSPPSDPAAQKRLEWCRDMLNASTGTAKLIGCSPEAIVAQAALETGWGRSAIGNNVFGIKADASWHGAVQVRRTWEVIRGETVFVDAPFRDYPTLADGILDHFEFLKVNRRYAGVFDPNDTMSDHDYFVALQKAGYATDPDYAEKLDAMLASVKTYEARMSEDGKPVPSPSVRTLMVGMSGPDVRGLQVKLGADVDGSFGPQTFTAVQTFQRAHGTRRGRHCRASYLGCSCLTDLRRSLRAIAANRPRLSGVAQRTTFSI